MISKKKKKQKTFWKAPLSLLGDIYPHKVPVNRTMLAKLDGINVF